MMNVTPNDRHGSAHLGLGGMNAGLNAGMNAGMNAGVNARAGDVPLVRLGESGEFSVAGGHPDIRGWPVIASDGRRLGRVHDLLLEPGAHRVRWLDVEVDRATVRAGEARCVLLPVGAARIDDARRQVRLPSLSGADAARLPGCEHGPLSRAREHELLTAIRPAADASPAELPGAEADFYDQPHFRDAEFWGRG